MEEKRKRRVKFKTENNQDLQPGWFHEWGLNVFEYNDGTVVNFSVGIVECDEGHVCLVHPEFIQFKK